MKILKTINKSYSNKKEQYEYKILHGLLATVSKMKRHYGEEECQRVESLVEHLGEDFETNKNKLLVAGYLIALWNYLYEVGCYDINGSFWNGKYEEYKKSKRISPLQRRELTEFDKKKYTFLEKVLTFNDTELINELLAFLQNHFPENWERRFDVLIESDCRKILANFFVDEDQEVTQDNIKLLKEFIRNHSNEKEIDVYTLAKRIACRTKASREYNECLLTAHPPFLDDKPCTLAAHNPDIGEGRFLELGELSGMRIIPYPGEPGEGTSYIKPYPDDNIIKSEFYLTPFPRTRKGNNPLPVYVKTMTYGELLGHCSNSKKQAAIVKEILNIQGISNPQVDTIVTVPMYLQSDFAKQTVTTKQPTNNILRRVLANCKANQK